MRNKRFLIFFNICFILCVAGITIATAYLYFNGSIGTENNLIVVIMTIQNIIFIIMSLVVLIYAATTAAPKNEKSTVVAASVPAVSKLLLTGKSGESGTEFNLMGKRSLIIGKDGHSDESLKYVDMEGSLTHEYAVLNLEGNYWYIESVSDLRNVGIRKDYDYIFRRLKSNMLYLIEQNDVIEIAGEKIIVK